MRRLGALALTGLLCACAPDIAPVIEALQKDPASTCAQLILPPPYGVQVYIARTATPGTTIECGGKISHATLPVPPAPPRPPAAP